MLLRHATLPDGSTGSVRIDGDIITAVGADLDPEPGEEAHDLTGRLLLPAPAEPHAHLDKALTADRVPNRTGDLLGAVEAWTAYRPSLTAEDIAERARRAALLLLAHGATAIRTHVDVAADLGLRGVEALAQVKAELAGCLDLQIVALVAPPLGGPDGGPHRALLREAMAHGADVVGGCPHLDPDPRAALEYCLDLAGELGRPLDLHMDETLNPDVLDLAHLTERVRATGFDQGVTASHCVSLGVQPLDVQLRLAAEVAETGIAVVSLPQTNLFLQGRNHPVATPRGLTALRRLLDAGATLAAGGDNLQDPFNLLGRGDPLEAAALLVAAGHLLPAEAYRAVSDGARQAMGLPPVSVAPGSPAELVALPAASVRAAIANAPTDRVVIHCGRLVAPAMMDAT